MNTQLQDQLKKVSAISNELPLQVHEDDFVSFDDLVPVKLESAKRNQRRLLFDIAEMKHEKKWEDILSLFYPVEEKIPEIQAYGLDISVRAELVFALGQINRFDEAISELSVCIQVDPDNFYFHNSLAYTAYNSVYAAKNREIFLRGTARKERILLAHSHFRKAQELRPEGVTNFYRQGMLYKQIENKTEKSVPHFAQAVSNWDGFDVEQKKVRHQERKNFIKALFQYSSALLEVGQAQKALLYVKRCIAEDETSNHLELVFKYFALGKVCFHLNLFKEAKDSLLFALTCKSRRSIDFVYELLARTYLALDDTARALESVNKVPEKKRRPYFQWTEADVLCAMKKFPQAKKVLLKSQERDKRSRHKALMRLAKLEYILGNFSATMQYAAAADKFFQERWGNRFMEGLFMHALGAYRSGDMNKARDLAETLKGHNSRYPGLNKLFDKLV